MTGTLSKRIRVMLVDDSELVRLGLTALLSTEPGLQVVAQAGTVAEAIQICAQVKPDVVLLDLRLPDGTGFDACREILARQPGVRILVLTSVSDDTLVTRAIQAGAHGYLLKEVHGRALVQAIVDVAAGNSILDPAVTARVMQTIKSGGAADALHMLSAQERRVLALVAEAKTNKEIGVALDLSEKTVKNYLANVFTKLGISSRTQAALYYSQHLRPPHPAPLR